MSKMQVKSWNDPELISFMRKVTCGGKEGAQPETKGEYKSKKRQGEDLTVDGYINKHGGIESSIDGSVHTTKSSYIEHIKTNNCVIKDF